VSSISAKKILSVILGAITLVQMAAGVSKAGDTENTKLLDAYKNFARSNGDKAQSLTVLAKLFSSLDVNGNGVSPAELSQAEKIWDAASRASNAQRALAYDLDGDFVVTRQEIETVLDFRRRQPGSPIRLRPAEVEREIGAFVERALAGDANKNGSLEGMELLSARARPGSGKFRLFVSPYELIHALLDADPNSDGLLTEAESHVLLAAIAGPNNSADKEQIASAPPVDENCQPVKVPEGSELVLVGAYEGSQVSTIAMAGQDEETSSASIIIEQGEKPVTIVLSSFDAMVWKFSGNVARVAKVVAVSSQESPRDGKSAVGIVGIPGEKVEFFTRANCLQGAYEQGSGARAQLSALTGREPDKFFGEYEIGVLYLPSGQNTKQEASEKSVLETLDGWAKRQSNNQLADFDKSNAAADQSALRAMAANVIRFNDSGIADFELNDVVSAAKAENYRVLPQESGLLQLVKAGVLTADEVETAGGIFKVVAPMRYPAGLTGAHSVNFVIKKGVELPSGDPAHSCVQSEDRKQVLDGHAAVCSR
jgi:hypothetical protein